MESVPAPPGQSCSHHRRSYASQAGRKSEAKAKAAPDAMGNIMARPMCAGIINAEARPGRYVLLLFVYRDPD